MSLLDQLVNADVTEDDDESNDPSNQYSNLTIRNTLTEISHVFLNENHLLALCRRHQALQSLIQMMKKELNDIQAENQSITQSITESRDLLAQHGQFYSEDNQSIEPDMSNHDAVAQPSLEESVIKPSQPSQLSDADKLFAVLSSLPDRPIGWLLNQPLSQSSTLILYLQRNIIPLWCMYYQAHSHLPELSCDIWEQQSLTQSVNKLTMAWNQFIQPMREITFTWLEVTNYESISQSIN